MAKRRKLTTAEQDRLLDDFYRDIYADDGNLNDENNLQFQDEGGGSDEDDNVDYTNEPAVEDENRDQDVSEDEEDIRLPRKQKFRTQKDVCNLDNFDKIPEQETGTFMWTHKSKDSTTCITTRPNIEANPRNRGRRPARDLPQLGGSTRLAQQLCKSEAGSWNAFISDDNLLKIVNYLTG